MKTLSDADLLRRLAAAVGQSRGDEVDLVRLIAEVDARRLYAHQAKPSMFLYCTEVLHLSEQEAYLRITVARASREHPSLLPMLRDGRLHLSGIARLTKYLTRANRDEILKRATHRSRREIERLIAELEPQPDAPPQMRKLPSSGAISPAGPAVRLTAAGSQIAGMSSLEPANGSGSSASAIPGQLCPDRVAGQPIASKPAAVQPLAPDRYRVQFTASAELHDKLERLQALMRPSVPDGDLGRIIEEAVTEKLERLEAKRFGKTKAPRKALGDTSITPSSRHVPAAVRRAVHERDGGRCTYQDVRGKRCTARDHLEFHHHDQAFGRGGDHSVRNVRLMCRTHNQLLAEQEYGKEKVARYRGRKETSRPHEPSRGVSEGNPRYGTRAEGHPEGWDLAHISLHPRVVGR